jgi:predicted P-loop ATPase
MLDSLPEQPDSSATTSKARISGNVNFRHKKLDLVRDDKDRPIWNMANAMEMLKSHPDWHGVLAFNRFTQRRMLLEPIAGSGTFHSPRPLEDDDYSDAQQWFNRNGFPRASSEIVSAAMRAACRAKTYDPLTDYLSNLKWDGKPRVGDWLEKYTGAEGSPYVHEAGKRWLISAVARAYKPGCKADHMLVLEGAQGQRKSSALGALAGPDYFSDSLPAMNTKDASSYLRGKWIVEVAELEAMRREMDAVKAFITREVESFRPAYGREEVIEPRRCIFAGTTNKDDWQRDETGGRRFWPVKVGKIDVDAIKKDRDQIWAEAVVLFKKGEVWWLQGDVEATARAEAADRMPVDPWREYIAKAIQGRQEITTKEILRELGFQPNAVTLSHSKRVAKELTAMGWVKGGRATGGATKFIPAR